MKKIILLIILAAIIQPAFTQGCLPEGITFSTQEQIDNFQTDYPGCTVIDGNVDISGNDITNLNGLNVLSSVGGNLNIGDVFNGNPTLNSLSGLNNISNIGGKLSIVNNEILSNLTGLDNLTSIAGSMQIGLLGKGNPSLSNLLGLNNLESIGGGLRVYSNISLSSLIDLNSLSFINLHIFIIDNDALTSLTGLEGVPSINGPLTLDDNDALKNLNGLSNLTFINGFISIKHNDSLSSLDGLANINATYINYLHIYGNSALSSCEVESICDYLVNTIGDVEIHDNATGCNSIEEVEEACLVGINAINDIGSEIIIYPNPASTEVFVSGKDEVKINKVNIYNQIGQKVLHKEGITQTIDVSMLQKGMYIIEVVTDKLKIRTKLIIE